VCCSSTRPAGNLLVLKTWCSSGTKCVIRVHSNGRASINSIHGSATENQAATLQFRKPKVYRARINPASKHQSVVRFGDPGECTAAELQAIRTPCKPPNQSSRTSTTLTPHHIFENISTAHKGRLAHVPQLQDTAVGAYLRMSYKAAVIYAVLPISLLVCTDVKPHAVWLNLKALTKGIATIMTLLLLNSLILQ